MASGPNTCEYRTLRRNFSIVRESLADTVNPAHFARKLNEVNLVSKDIVDEASIMRLTPAQRIQPVVNAVHSQIKLRGALYHKFIGVVQQFNTQLAELLEKFHEMLSIVSGIVDLKSLGQQLDLDPVKLNELQQGSGSPGQYAEELLVLWQEKDGDPSWEKLARALKRMGEHEKARRIEEEHAHYHSEAVGDVVPEDGPLSVAEAREEQDRLQGKFEALVTSTWDTLKQEQVDVPKLCHTISILPIMIKGEHKKFLLENHPQLCDARNLDAALFLLNIYMDYLNYSLLEHIISKHGNAALKLEIKQYVADLRSFRRRTPLLVFWKIQPKEYTETPVELKSLVLKHGKATPMSTLEDVEHFRQNFARQYSLTDLTLKLANIQSGSVVVTLLIASSVVDEVKMEIADGNTDFFRENEVTQVILDGTTLFEEQQPARDTSTKVQLWEQGFEWVSLHKATSRDDDRALDFEARLHTNRTEPTAEFVRAMISNGATAALSDGLESNQILRELKLHGCKISTTGVTALTTALFSNTLPKTLRWWEHLTHVHTIRPEIEHILGGSTNHEELVTKTFAT